MYSYIYLANLFHYFILYQYMRIMLNVYTDLCVLYSIAEYYCINMVLYKSINIYIYIVGTEIQLSCHVKQVFPNQR